jgi:hypothetical protein
MSTVGHVIDFETVTWDLYIKMCDSIDRFSSCTSVNVSSVYDYLLCDDGINTSANSALFVGALKPL